MSNEISPRNFGLSDLLFVDIGTNCYLIIHRFCSVFGSTNGAVSINLCSNVKILMQCLFCALLKKMSLQEDDDQKIAVMRKAFQMFDKEKTGFIETLKISTILNTMGQLFDDNELKTLIEQNDPSGEF